MCLSYLAVRIGLWTTLKEITEDLQKVGFKAISRTHDACPNGLSDLTYLIVAVLGGFASFGWSFDDW